MGLKRKKMTQTEAVEHIEKNKAIFRELYLKRDMTARKTAENQNIEYDEEFAKALFRVFGAKGKGKGGARLGSGNKKGVKFCGICRKKWGDCQHTK